MQLHGPPSSFHICSCGSISLHAGKHKISPASIFAFAFFICFPRCLQPVIPASRSSVHRAKLCLRHVTLVSSNTRSPLVTAGRRCPSDPSSAPFHLGAAAAALAHQAWPTPHLRPGVRACVSTFAPCTS